MGLGDLFGGGGKASAPNTDALKNIATTGAQKKREIIGGGFKDVAPLTGQFKGQVGEAVGQAGQRRQALAGSFLKQLGKGQTAADTQQFNLAKQQILGSLPELQRASREASAATGGLQRGAAQVALQQPITEAQQQIGQVAGGIALQSQQKQNDALNQIFTGDRAFELQKLGIDANVAKTLLDTGRSDILGQALQLAGVEGQLTTDLLGIEQNALEAQAAADAANAQRKSALTGALLGVGGTIGGAVLGGPIGASIGGRLGSAVQPGASSPTVARFNSQQRTGG